MLQLTKKELNKAALNVNFMRKALAVGGLSSLPLNEKEYQDGDFVATEVFGGRLGNKTTTWDAFSKEEGYEKYLKYVSLTVGKFDTEVRVYPDGRLTAWYRFTQPTLRQYPCNQMDWMNLMLEFGFVVNYKPAF